MIVRTGPDHLLLITQPDHAALSAAIMGRWRRDGLPAHPRREWLLLATREHDAGWAEVDVWAGEILCPVPLRSYALGAVHRARGRRDPA